MLDVASDETVLFRASLIYYVIVNTSLSDGFSMARLGPA